MEYRSIDLETYPRRAHFAYFRTLAYPFAGVTVPVEVTALRDACKAWGCSFTLAFLHCAALAADRVPQLRQRIHEGGIVEYAHCPTSHIELLEDGTYRYCTLRHTMDFARYLEAAEAARRRCRTAPFQEDEEAAGMFFVSAMPWLEYTALVQPVAGQDDSNPRITWGKFAPDGQGRLMMPVSLLAHHALVDGVHMAAFYDNLREEIAHCVEGRNP